MELPEKKPLERGLKLGLLKALLHQGMIATTVFDQVVGQWER